MPRENNDEPNLTITHYAMLDDGTRNPDGSDESDFVVLDCITRQAADSLGDASWADIEEGDERLSETLLLQVKNSDLWTRLQGFNGARQWIAFKLEPLEQGVVPPDNVDGLIATFVSLAGAEEGEMPRFFLSLISVVAAKLRKLAFMVGVYGSARKIKGVLSKAGKSAGTSRNVMVYDIGQGSANALVDEWGHPCLFYDLGWPTSFNQGSRPPYPPDLFACDGCARSLRFRPPVILSHWDYDHWAYAVANHNYHFGSKASSMTFKPAAMDRVWIMPKPPGLTSRGKGLGPTHMRLLTSLPKANRIAWPNTLQMIEFCAGVVTRTNRKKLTSERNNQALVWFVIKADNRTKATLLPGDVDYPNMRWPIPAPDIESLVASHHGGAVTVDPAIAASVLPTVLAVSVGHPNCHGHPNSNALLNHAFMGWKPEFTWTRAKWPVGAVQTNGAILVKLDPTDPDPTFCCACVVAGNLGNTQNNY